MATIIRKKWNWIGHILRRHDDDIAKAALDWNPQGSRKRELLRTNYKNSQEN